MTDWFNEVYVMHNDDGYHHMCFGRNKNKENAAIISVIKLTRKASYTGDNIIR